MIATLTLNPSLDYTARLDALEPGQVCRMRGETLRPGGKGINVSLMLRALGHESLALGFTAGFTGEEIERSLREAGVFADFVRLERGLSRINVKLKAREETDLNGSGPEVREEELEALLRRFDALPPETVCVLSGSLPRGVRRDVYAEIMRRAEGRGLLFAADTEGEALTEAARRRPFLVKPNHHELSALTGERIVTREQAVRPALRLARAGAEHVLVSLAAEGAVLVCRDGEVLDSPAPEGRVLDSVGAGDCMVAGFIAGWLESGGGRAEAFRMAVASGSASAFSEGFASRGAVEALRARIRPRRVAGP